MYNVYIFFTLILLYREDNHFPTTKYFVPIENGGQQVSF